MRDHLAGDHGIAGGCRRPEGAADGAIRWQWPVIGVLGLAAAVVAGLVSRRVRNFRINRATVSRRSRSIRWGNRCRSGRPMARRWRMQVDVRAPQPDQVFVRYLDSPTPIQITSGPDSAEPVAWAPDGKRVIFRSSRAPVGLWSVSVVGGEPESFMPTGGIRALAVSPDLRTVAVMRPGDDGVNAVWISSPPGAAPVKYLPNPMASRALYNSTNLRFSPDGKSILLFLRGDKGRTEAWLMPYPPNTSKPPRLVQADLDALWRHTGVCVDARQPACCVVLRVLAGIFVAALDGRHGVARADRADQRHGRVRVCGGFTGRTAHRVQRIRGRLRSGVGRFAARHRAAADRYAAGRIYACVGRQTTDSGIRHHSQRPARNLAAYDGAGPAGGDAAGFSAGDDAVVPGAGAVARRRTPDL